MALWDIFFYFRIGFYFFNFISLLIPQWIVLKDYLLPMQHAFTLNDTVQGKVKADTASVSPLELPEQDWWCPRFWFCISSCPSLKATKARKPNLPYNVSRSLEGEDVPFSRSLLQNENKLLPSGIWTWIVDTIFHTIKPSTHYIQNIFNFRLKILTWSAALIIFSTARLFGNLCGIFIM